jgi:hypothetical protein
MNYQKTYIEGDNQYFKYMEFMNKLAKIEHKNLAKIHFTTMKEGSFIK